MMLKVDSGLPGRSDGVTLALTFIQLLGALSLSTLGRPTL